MIKQPRRHQVELLVIGSGLAGMAASLFALARGVSVAQVGNSGVIAFTTGYLDLLGHDGRGFVDDPWQALIRLRQDEPRHPLANISEDEIRAAFTSFTRTLTEMGLGYTAPGQRNVLALTPAGTLKPTLSLPLTMQPAISGDGWRLRHPRRRLHRPQRFQRARGGREPGATMAGSSRPAHRLSRYG